eukprot:snap_masked-scaffold_47-processed-gene-0.9-mRNA-1 protein AED:0.00 eAED:0.00 QI:0/-1/0/1/-1/1/1/0/871
MEENLDDAAAALLGLDTEPKAAKKKKKKKPKKKPAPKPAEKSQKAPPKLNAAARLAQQRLEEKKKLEEEMRLQKEEEERLEKLRLEEEERERKEEEERKRIRREERKARGKPLTKAQRLKLQKAEQRRQQLIRQGLIQVDQSGQIKRKEAVKAVEAVKTEPKLATATKEVIVEEVKEENRVEKREEIVREEKGVELKKEETEEIEEKEEIEESEDDWEAQFASDKEEPEKVDVQPVKEEAKAPVVKEEEPEHKKKEFRSPIICVMGHVDTGKTKLLDKLRHTTVQMAEAGGITQQIGATFFPMENLKPHMDKVSSTEISVDINLPGLLLIDTPGHESFSNLRQRGTNLCDLAIVVIDLMHGLEQQTIESLKLLRDSKTPFIVALNKVDRLYGWESKEEGEFNPIRGCLSKQKESVWMEFEERAKNVKTQLMEQEFNSALYWENNDYKRVVSLVPTSAHTGEGLSDLLFLLCSLSQSLMTKRLLEKDRFECNVVEVRKIEGIGTSVDVILVNGLLKEGDEILAATMGGPVRTQVKALLTPQPMKEMRVTSGGFMRHKSVKAAMGVKIVGHGSDLENAVAGTQIYLVGKKEKNRDIKEKERKVMESVNSIVKSINTSSAGVSVQASTLGSLEALIDFLRSMKIPISSVNIGPIHKKDVMKASSMLEQKPEYAIILAFNVKVTKNAKEMAAETGVKIFTAEIIYHLFDQFTAYMEDIKQMKKEKTKDLAVFPCILEIIKENVFMKKSPLVFGVDVKEGILKTGTPIIVPEKLVPNPDPHGTAPQVFLELGKVTSIESDGKAVERAKAGSKVAVKIEGNQYQSYVQYGRHFDYKNKLVSKLSRESIDALKLNFKDELEKNDWMAVVKLKKLLSIK